MRRRWRPVAAYALMLVTGPLLWLWLIRVSHLPPMLLPPPGQVGAIFVGEGAALCYHLGVTLYEALIGYAVANVLAVGLAALFVYVPWTEEFVSPWTVVVRNAPFVTVASILVVTFGDTLTPKVIVVVVVSFFPLLANLVKGLRAADPVLLDRLETLHASRWDTFAKVRWPAALPYYVAAHEIAFTGSILAAIVAEWFFARQGLGFLIVQATVDYRADRLYAVSLLSCALALVVYGGCKAWEHWLFRWKKDLRA